jgi:hypothetical protein
MAHFDGGYLLDPEERGMILAYLTRILRDPRLAEAFLDWQLRTITSARTDDNLSFPYFLTAIRNNARRLFFDKPLKPPPLLESRRSESRELNPLEACIISELHSRVMDFVEKRLAPAEKRAVEAHLSNRKLSEAEKKALSRAFQRAREALDL